jgi:hypothetical protein
MRGVIPFVRRPTISRFSNWASVTVTVALQPFYDCLRAARWRAATFAKTRTPPKVRVRAGSMEPSRGLGFLGEGLRGGNTFTQVIIPHGTSGDAPSQP